jgi:hypothetical protein
MKSKKTPEIILPEIKSDRKLAEALQVSTRTIVEWKKLPGSPIKGSEGWNLSDWKAFVAENGLGTRSKGSTSQELEELKAVKMAAQIRVLGLQTERQELRNEVAMGKYIQIDKARSDFALCYNPMLAHMKQMKHRMGQLVVGLESGAAAKVIGADFQESLDRFTIPEHLLKDPFWRGVKEDFEAMKRKAGKL